MFFKICHFMTNDFACNWIALPSITLWKEIERNHEDRKACSGYRLVCLSVDKANRKTTNEAV